ncbi:MAG: hypothetical protein WC602_01315 [archaeon]
MNSRGFVSLLVLAMLAIPFLHAAGLSDSLRRQSGQAIVRETEMEKAVALRSELEENTDFIIQSALLEEALKQAEPEEARREISARLMRYYETESGERGNEIGLFNSRFAGSNYSLLLSEQNPEELSREDIESESIVTMNRLPNGTIEAEFFFTGGSLREMQAFAVISEGKTRMVFVIPRNYASRAVAVVP